MKILVTGGCGFIGSNLVRLLVEQKNCQVINLDKLTYAGNPASLTDLAEHPNYTFQQADISDSNFPLSAFLQEHQPDAIMHLAAESHVDRSIDGPGEFIQTNIVGTYHLLQASLAYWRSLPAAGEDGRSDMEDGAAGAEDIEDAPSGLDIEDGKPDSEKDTPYPISHIPYPTTKSSFRFLHVSTDEVYGSLAPDAPGFSETTPYDPHSPYSASKAASDHLARAWADTYGLPVLVTNCSNNYGPYQFPEKLIPVVILKCLRGEPIPVYGKGENIRDWLYVEDHAEALYTVLTKGRVGETYNIGGNNEKKNIDLVRLLCEIMDDLVEDGRLKMGDSRSEMEASQSEDRQKAQSPNFKLPSAKSFQDLITFVTDRPGHDMRYAIDARKIHDELGWEPKQDSKSGFEKTVQWYLDNQDWWENILSGDYKLDRLGKA